MKFYKQIFKFSLFDPFLSPQGSEIYNSTCKIFHMKKRRLHMDEIEVNILKKIM